MYLIFYYEKLFKIDTKSVLKLNYMKMTPELIREIKKLDEYSNQAKFLVKYNIDTYLQLAEFEKDVYKKLAPLQSERENLWKKHKRAKTEDEKVKIEERIVTISKEITPISQDLQICRNIQTRTEKIKQYELHMKLQQDKEKTQKEKRKERDRER